jgi:hypothetical protein
MTLTTLPRKGKIVSGKKGRIVTDGPFAESKEAIAGYVLLQVDEVDQPLIPRIDFRVLQLSGSC